MANFYQKRTRKIHRASDAVIKRIFLADTDIGAGCDLDVFADTHTVNFLQKFSAFFTENLAFVGAKTIKNR